MDLPTLVFIGTGLAMDCFAVALARGAQKGINKFRLALVLAATFGIFQAGMTIIGWATGSFFNDLIAPVDHWIAFIILVAIGLKMIIEGYRDEPPAIHEPTNIRHVTSMVLLAIATSIDALAIGLGFAFLNIDILVPGLIIGLIAAGFTAAGVLLGSRLEKILGNRIEILGGIILIVTGIKILAEHLV